MKQYVRLCFLGILLSITSNSFAYLHVSGTEILDSQEQKIYLRGFGLGNWLVNEGYMWNIGGTEIEHSRQVNSSVRIRGAIMDLIGSERTEKLYDTFERHFVTEDDIAEFASWGVNSLRIPINGNRFFRKVGQETQFDPSGFIPLDQIISWCEKYGIYVIIDMHAAPGGQNQRNHADSDGVARLWTEPETYQPRLVSLWKAIADRYCTNKTVGGYELLNEPMLGSESEREPEKNHQLRKLYEECTRAIRSVDKNHIIVIEGSFWAQDYTGLFPAWDNNLVLSFHMYPPAATQEAVKSFVEAREKYNIPLWHGETGENSAEYHKKSVEFLRSEGIGWNWWCTKKTLPPSTRTCPYSVKMNPFFVKTVNYWENRGPRPSKEEAEKGLHTFALANKTEESVYLTNAVRALGLDPDGKKGIQKIGNGLPLINIQPQGCRLAEGHHKLLRIRAISGTPVKYIWKRNGKILLGENHSTLNVRGSGGKSVVKYVCLVSNETGTSVSAVAEVTNSVFDGTYEARDFPYTSTGFIYDEQLNTLSLSSSNSSTVTIRFTGPSGRYNILLHTLGMRRNGKPLGASVFKLMIAGKEISSSTITPGRGGRMIPIPYFDIKIKKGDEIRITAASDEKARGHWQSIEFFRSAEK